MALLLETWSRCRAFWRFSVRVGTGCQRDYSTDHEPDLYSVASPRRWAGPVRRKATRRPPIFGPKRGRSGGRKEARGAIGESRKGEYRMQDVG